MTTTPTTAGTACRRCMDDHCHANPPHRPDEDGPAVHKWNSEFCSCGQDTVTCQGCGKRVCGNITTPVQGKGNIGPECLWKFGLGHQ